MFEVAPEAMLVNLMIYNRYNEYYNWVIPFFVGR